LSTDAHVADSLDGLAWKAPIKRKVLPLIFNSADGVFAPSTRTKSYLQELGVSAPIVYLMPYVVDNDFFRRGADLVDRDSLRRSWGVSSEETVALFVGKLAPWKRPGDLIEALVGIEGVTAVFAGEGTLRSALQDRSAELDLEGRVRFVGFQNQTQLPGVYASSDVLVLPSAYEAFGVVVNEMFACGHPAIVSDACGAVGDLVVEGVTGWVIPVGAVDDLQEALKAASDNPTRLKRGAAARERIESWDLEANVTAFVGACHEIVERSNAKARGREIPPGNLR
jgi:glycosyltransferase involved in cell wall biosynthesis